MRRMRRQALLAALALVCAPAAVPAERASARHAFDAANRALNGGRGYESATNEDGTLAWGESYVMMSYAAMFRASGDPSYLVMLAAHATRVMQSTDAARGIRDYAGRSRACWQSTRYSEDAEPYCWAVHSGMLLTPMAELAWLVRRHPEYARLPVPGRGTLGETAAALLPEVEAAAAVFDADWRSGPGPGEGHYVAEAGARFSAFAGRALPLNMMLALGRTELALWQATRKPMYKQRAAALGRYFEHRLTFDDGAYVWTYRGTKGRGAAEDISHASIDVDFAARLHAAGLVFSAADMRRFARTLVDKVHVGDATFANRVDGSGGTNAYPRVAALWLALSPYDARVWPLGAALYAGAVAVNGPGLLARALIAEYAAAEGGAAKNRG